MSTPLWSYTPLPDQTPVCRGVHLQGTPWLVHSISEEKSDVLSTTCPYCFATWELDLLLQVKR